MLADGAVIAGHRAVAQIAVPAVDAATFMQTRLTVTRRARRSFTVIDQSHHLLITTHLNQVDPCWVHDQITDAADEPSTPDSGPQINGQRRGVLRPLRTESTDVQWRVEIQCWRTGQTSNHVTTFIVVYSYYTVDTGGVRDSLHLVWKSTPGLHRGHRPVLWRLDAVDHRRRDDVPLSAWEFHCRDQEPSTARLRTQTIPH